MKLVNTKGWKRPDFIRFYTDVWGCPCIPIHGDYKDAKGKNMLKKPMVQWTAYNPAKGGALPAEQELKSWFDIPCKAFKQVPWGLAIVLQHDLFSIDIDTDELFTDFKERGAFPKGACIYKSARGYHIIMRSINAVPYTVKEHDPVLVAINPAYDELGIGGDNNHLSNMPDTPGRQWLELYDEPVGVDYNAWCNKYLGWTKADPYKARAGWQDEIICPWHEWGSAREDGSPHEPSLRCNTDTGAFQCHGCPEHGTFTKLAAQAKEVGMPLPQYVTDWLTKFHERATGDKMVIEPAETEELPEFMWASTKRTFEELPPGIVDGVLWRGDVGTVFAPAGAGKSSVCNAAAGDAVLGREWWGLEGWQCQQGLKVLILDIENRPGETHAAIRLACENDKQLEHLAIAELDGVGFDIYNPKWADWLEQRLDKYRFDLMFIDNLNKYTSSNVVDPYEMKKIVSINRRLARKYDLAVVAIHHTGHLKLGEDGEYIDVRPTGGASIRDDANFEFQVLKIKSKKDQVRVTCTKMRSRVSRVHSGDEFVLRYDFNTTRMTPVGNEYLRVMLNQLTTKYGSINKLSAALGVAQPTVSNWVHGVREPRGEYKKLIEDLCKKDGIVPRLTEL